MPEQFAFIIGRVRNNFNGRIIFIKLLNAGLKTSEIYGNLGKIEYCQGNNQMALLYLINSLKMNADIADTYYYLGCVYMNLGQSQHAKASFLKALELDKNLIDSKRRLDLIK